MKTILTTLAIILFSTASVSAKNVIVYSNIMPNDKGQTKEYITYNTKEHTPINRTVFVENADGKKQSKTLYRWTENAWVCVHKMEYTYDDKLVTTLIYTKWNDKEEAWSGKSEYLTYTYDGDGELLTTLQIPTDSATDILTVK